jgi:hypothetical protein
MSNLKMVDKSGRVIIKELSGAQVIVERLNEDEFVIRRAAVIPARELWLHQNPVAMGMVQRGIEDLKAGRFAADPTKDEDDSWIDGIDDNDDIEE